MNAKLLYNLISSIIGLSAFGVSADVSDEGLKFGGSVRANYAYRDYEQASKDKGGDFYFDVATLTLNGKIGGWGVSADYRLSSGTNYIKHGYGFYDVNDELQVQVGINKVPFGNRELISNSWWFGLPYYLGFEDDSDVGFKLVYEKQGWHTDVAFYKSAEYASAENKRYAADLYSGTINGTKYSNEETNQFNIRQTYTIENAYGETTLGGSIEVGQIYNNSTKNNGDRYAVALHLDSTFNTWNIQLQAMQYEYSAADSFDDNKIGISVVSWQYEIASKGQVYSANIAKNFKTSFGSIKCYNDFGLMTPDVNDDSYDNSMQNVTGCAISSGPTYTMIDFVLGKNMTFSTANNDHIGLPEVGDDWDKRVNINFGFYF